MGHAEPICVVCFQFKYSRVQCPVRIFHVREDQVILLSIPGQIVAQECRLRDFTVKVAGIRLNGITLLPLIFELSLDAFHTTERCRLISNSRDCGDEAVHRLRNAQSPFDHDKPSPIIGGTARTVAFQ